MRAESAFFLKIPLSSRFFYTFKERALNLFPLDCGWRLGGDVIDYAVDAAHLVDDLVAYLCQEFVGEVYPVSGHAICRDHGA